MAFILLGLALPTSDWCLAAENDVEVRVRRLPENPIISFCSAKSLGNKINGPSIIRVPSWVEAPLGKYYMYFAHHKGEFIRLAYSDSIAGPWTVYEPGTLRLAQATVFWKHIASPDVHVDNDSRVIRMYFHGSRHQENQKTSVATSSDGLKFVPTQSILGDAYFRVFRWNDFYYAIDAHGFLNRSRHPEVGWTMRKQPLISPEVVDDQFGRRTNVRIRHSAVLVKNNTLYLLYTRKGDAPERILLARVPLTQDWTDWTADEPIEVLRPQTEYEGIGYQIAPSKKGGAVKVQQLRDPCLFGEDGKHFLFYAIAGESGIAVAEITIHDRNVK